MAAITLYSPKDVIVLLGGFYRVDGYAENTFINILKDVKPFDVVRAMDGEQARVYRKDKGYTVELTFAQSSASNNILSAIYNVDVATQMGKFPLLIKDTKGTTSFFAGTAWVEDIPAVTFSNGMETRTWKLGTSESGLNVGGNVDGAVLDILGLTSTLPLLKDFGII